MLALGYGEEKNSLQEKLRTKIKAGSIDVNIMSKLDKPNFTKDNALLPPEYSDAQAALRGYAKSRLHSSIVFSAGFNPRLYAYAEQFDDFFPDKNGKLVKKIILKVSDYRSAIVQGKIFAKKGLWVSEFRVESGLNCGGHAFATDGLLLGPILEEFKTNKQILADELLGICNAALLAKGKEIFNSTPELKLTVQGGIGTFNEDQFLFEHYEVDGTGWGSPFLLVPEVTNVDEATLKELSVATKDDFYLSDASPLGIPFNNFRKSSSEIQRLIRIDKGRPGSPCYKKFLSSDTEFSETPICTASREYQSLKIKQIKEKHLSEAEYKEAFDKVIGKDCLCEGLGAAVLLKNHLHPAHNLNAVAICPGPNLAYFSGIFTLKQMADHIYGRINLLNSVKRSNMFINELVLYINYLMKELGKETAAFNANKTRQIESFKLNLLKGIEYYGDLIKEMKRESSSYLSEMKKELDHYATMIQGMQVPAFVQ